MPNHNSADSANQAHRHLPVVLEQLCGLGVETVDRQLARRSLSEAVAAWPGNFEKRWWKWLIEAGHSLGHRFRVIDCEPDEVVMLMLHGARIALFDQDADQPWCVAVGSKRSKVQVFEGELDKHRWVGRRSLRKRLRSRSNGPIRIVLFDPTGDAVTTDSVVGEHPSPWARLQALLHPEWSDIWIVLVFALFVGLMTLATPIAVEALVNTVAFGRLLQPVVILALLLFGFLAFAAAMRAFQTWVVEIIQRRLFARVAGALAYRLPRVEVGSLAGQYAPELVNRFFDVVTVQKISAQLLLDGVALTLGAIIGMSVLAFYHPWLLAFDILLLLMILLIVFVLGRGAVSSSIKESKSKYNTAAWLEELARCQIAFRNDGAPEFASERADFLVETYLTQRRNHFRILFRQILFALCLQAIASTVLLGLGGFLVISGELTLGQLVAAELIVTVIVGSFAKLGKHMESFYDMLAAVDKLGVLFDLPLEPAHGALSLTSDRGAELRMRNVKCAGMVGPAVNLMLEPGARLAVTGPEGVGKSALMQRIYGLGETASGHLEIDEVDVRDLRRDMLRHHVALVRGVEVFGGTIAENTSLERPGIGLKEIRESLKDVGLLDTVMAMSDGLDTRLTPTGDPLSDNQAKRLMLARAIVAKPRLLVIDGLLDGFSDDDAERLAAGLLDRERPWTAVVVTGRNAISAMCDQHLDLSPATSPRNRLKTALDH